MVKKRLLAELRSKMPVKTASKDKIQTQEIESASMSDKDNSDFSTKETKVWSRELRNRFVIASNKRSLRFTNDVNPQRHVRSCRMAITNRNHYTLSQSDDDDEHLFPARNARKLRHHKRRHSSPEPGQEDNEMPPVAVKRARSNSAINGHTSKSPPDDEEIPEEDSAGIRRSTRQRKLKYENYSDSWIVGAQTLRGYPQSNYVDLQAVYSSTPYPSRSAKNLKREPIEEDEEDMKAGDDTEEADTEDNDNIENQNAANDGKRNMPRRSTEKERCNRPEADVDQTTNDNAAFEDMYSRVKRKRTRRSIYDGALLSRRRQLDRKCIQRREQSSEESESSTEDDPPRPTRGRNLERVVKRKYHLRETKPTVKRFQITPVDESRRKSSRTIRAVLCETRAVRRRHRLRSSSSSSSSSRERFDRKKPKSKTSRSRLPQLLAGEERRRGKPESSGGLADVDPVSLDTSIRFSHVGGLEEHVRCLQEMVVFPMLYSDVFKKYHITPPKGVLFHGPPGTGKTLIARALANECSQGEHKVTFFMRKGADCLSKWVGESERQLRLLFEQAYEARPSIIFFDELDGLAPVRSAKQDQIHASIVSTLLALMDGLNNRGEIIVIGATNRIDAIDPALRRPGRFDRELLFSLPSNKERQEILKIHVSKWERPPSQTVLTSLAEKSVGYCGSDLRALCSEAVIQALRRRYPQIYKSNKKLLLNPDAVKVERCDFELARHGIIPASHRVSAGFGRKLPNFLESLLGDCVTELTTHIRSVFQCGFLKGVKTVRMVKSPRLLLLGQRKATSLVTSALLHKMECCPILTLDLATIYSESARSPEEATVQVLNEVRRTIPCVLLIPDITVFWKTVGPTVRSIFMSLLNQLDSTLPIFLLATAVSELPVELKPMFSQYRSEIYNIKPPTAKQKEEFFRPLLIDRASMRPPREKKKEPLEVLPEAPPPPPPKLNEKDLQKIYAAEEHKLRELRIFLRQICGKLARNKQFFMFSKPVDINEVPDYLNIINQPMDLETMMTKIDLHKYTCAQDFLTDIELICANALEYNPDRDPADKLIRHRACYLRDTAYALIKAEMDSDFEERCRDIRKARIERGADIDKFAPDFIHTAAMGAQRHLLQTPKQNSPSDANHQLPASNLSANLDCNQTATGSNVETFRSATKASLALHERRRRKISAWNRGYIAKKRTPKSKPPPQSNSSSEKKNKVNSRKETASCVEDTVVSEMDSQAHSTPCKRDKRNTVSKDEEKEEPLENGIVGLSSEDEADDRLGDGRESGCNNYDSVASGTDPPSSTTRSCEKSLVMNRAALSRLLSEVVKVTQHVSSMEVLIDLYAQLRQVIARYHRLWNRAKLPQELDAELKRFSAEHKEEFLEQDESFNISKDEASLLH